LEHRRVALFTSEATDNSTRLAFLRRVENRLASLATEKDEQWSLVRHWSTSHERADRCGFAYLCTASTSEAIAWLKAHGVPRGGFEVQ
jgi:hypothetical protein